MTSTRGKLEATKPLVRVVTLTPEGSESIMIRIKYEKIARFCAHCGLIGHGHLECGGGEHAEDDLKFGAWMIAGEENWRPGTPRFRNTTYTASEGHRSSYTEARDRGGCTAGRIGRGRRQLPSAWRAINAVAGERGAADQPGVA